MWIEITEANLLTRLSGTELQSFREAALADGQPDPVAPTIKAVVNVVRGYIAACAENTLEEGEKIPEKLLDAALDMIVIRVMSRAAGVVIDPAGVRKDAGRQAIRLLEQVAACQFKLEAPLVVEDEVLAMQKPSFVGRERLFRDQGGL